MTRSHRRRFPLRILLLIVVGLIAWAVERTQRSDTGPPPTAPPPQGGSLSPSSSSQEGAELIAEAFRDHRSKVWVEGEGRVQRLLADDDEGSRHQRIILLLDNAMTVLLSHNIDLAPRVPAGTGDRLRFRGLYEWNAQGGVVHWTHHDPQGRKAGGWIRLGDEAFR